jgi:hypothetical protein
MENPKFQIFKGEDGKFYFRLRAKNGEPILASEAYEKKPGAKDGIASVQKNAPHEERYERKRSKNDKDFFVLKAANGEPIGKSEMYNSADAMENGIESVKTNGITTNIEDLT